MNENSAVPFENSGRDGKPEAETENPLHVKMRADSRFYLTVCAITGVIFSLLFTEAAIGVNVPVFCVVLLICTFASLKRLGLLSFKKSAVCALGILLLSVSSFLTRNSFILAIDRAGIFILYSMLLLRAFCVTDNWQFGKYFTACLRLIFTAIAHIAEPVRLVAALKKSSPRENGRLKFVVLGLIISVPLLFFVLFLLRSADVLFNSMFLRLFSVSASFEKLATTVIEAIVLFLLAFFGLYCALSGQAAAPVPSEIKPTRRHEPLVAVTFTAILAVTYLVFCAFQVIFLFFGSSGSLPDGYTYSQYARQGFFQLLFVSMLNAALVIFCSWKFGESRLLRALDTVICACTYILIASSAWRMLLYVEAYGLTFLRVLVLWFLGVLAIIMCGIVISMYARRFNLFRFSFGVCLALWLCFSLSKPDLISAKYNLNTFGMSDELASEVLYEMSEDAIPAISGVDYAGVYSEEWQAYLSVVVERTYSAQGLRGFNLSLWQAHNAIKNG